jgi:hypothetical protein
MFDKVPSLNPPDLPMPTEGAYVWHLEVIVVVVEINPVSREYKIGLVVDSARYKKKGLGGNQNTEIRLYLLPTIQKMCIFKIQVWVRILCYLRKINMSLILSWKKWCGLWILIMLNPSTDLGLGSFYVIPRGRQSLSLFYYNSLTLTIWLNMKCYFKASKRP